MSSSAKHKSLEDFWDRTSKKLLVYVLEGVNICTKKAGPPSSFLKLATDKQKHKTATVHKNDHALWNEIFLFEVTEPMVPLDIELYSKQALGPAKLIGYAKVPIPVDAQDEPIELWVDLEVPLKVKESNKDHPKPGQILIRIVYSTSKETPQAIPFNEGYNFSYKQHADSFKTGDLLVYSGIGVLDALVQLESNSPHSRVAMIVKLPNKYTGESQLFLLEVTRNIGLFCDAFVDKMTQGVNIFRFYERLHFINAKIVSWVPLQEPLDPSAGLLNMLDYVTGLHQSRQGLPELPALPSEIASFLAMHYDANLLKHPMILYEANSSQIAMNALKLGGIRVPFEQYVSPKQLISAPCFSPPVVVRQRNENTLSLVNKGQGVTQGSMESHEVQRSIPAGITEPQPQRAQTEANQPPPIPPKVIAPHRPARSDNNLAKPEEQSNEPNDPEISPRKPAVPPKPSRPVNMHPASEHTQPPLARNSSSPILPTKASSTSPRPSGEIPQMEAPPADAPPAIHQVIPRGIASSASAPPPIPAKPMTLRPKKTESPPDPLSSSTGESSPLSAEKPPLDSVVEVKDIQLQKSSFYNASIKFDFSAENPGELTVAKGTDVVVLDDKHDNDWALVHVVDQPDNVGCVPMSFICPRSRSNSE